MGCRSEWPGQEVAKLGFVIHALGLVGLDGVAAEERHGRLAVNIRLGSSLTTSLLRDVGTRAEGKERTLRSFMRALI